MSIVNEMSYKLFRSWSEHFHKYTSIMYAPNTLFIFIRLCNPYTNYRYSQNSVNLHNENLI